MEFLKQYEILLKKAKTDLKVAKNTLRDFENGDEDLDLEVIMFHLQQCVEKLLKTLLVYNKYHVVKTHDIEELILTMNDQKIVVIENIEKLIPLTGFAVEGRYAIIHDDLEDANKYIKILDELLDFVQSEIK